MVDRVQHSPTRSEQCLPTFKRRLPLARMPCSCISFWTRCLPTLKQARNRQEAALRMALMGFPSSLPSSLDEEQSAALMKHYESGKHMTPEQALQRLRASCQEQNSGQT